MKLTRFLIADNPMVEGSPSAIIHTVNLMGIIEIIEGHVQVKEGTYSRWFTYEAELYTFRVHHLFTTEFDGEQHHIIVDKLLNRAWHWFMAYMKWEDEQVHFED